MNIDSLKEHVVKSIDNAYKNVSALPEDIISMEGMSGWKTRHLYNNMCSLPNAKYLEIGTNVGCSIICALYNNDTIEAYGVDDWSYGANDMNRFYNNIDKFLPRKMNNITMIEKDCFQITAEEIKSSIDIYVYDADHSFDSQKKAITHFYPFFSKYVIIMIDDWTCDSNHVKSGTLAGFSEVPLKVHYSHEINLVNTDKQHTPGDTFWNGCGIFLCERTDI